jgi:predicted DNA-binding ribbon-helix-helix protein
MPDSNIFAPGENANAGRRPTETAIRKRSVSLGGHRTSVSLEQAFWEELSRIARSRNQSTNALVAEIDRHRGTLAGEGAANLSSAVRLFVLGELRRAAGFDNSPSIPATADERPQ